MPQDHNAREVLRPREKKMEGLRDRFAQGMLLSGVGDAIGYRNGRWEFCHSGAAIYKELQELGGIDKIIVKLPGWSVSDDTVMHLATGKALIESSNQDDKEKLFLGIAKAYKECMNDMAGRAPGITCMSGTRMLKPLRKKGYQIPFNPKGGGCGAAMRAMCIGLRYCKPEQRDDLIAVSVESGRMTHHHPVGYLGSLASALFTSYAVQGKPICSWGQGLLETVPLARKYVKSTNHCVKENEEAGDYFEQAWKKYLDLRGLTDGKSEPQFPDQFGFEERDEFVKSVSFSGWGGASGHDAPLIAYDALLGAGSNWRELCNRAMFHGGDSDSTGVIAACWYGVMYGIADVPVYHYKLLEYRDRLIAVGEKLCDLAFSGVDTESASAGWKIDSYHLPATVSGAESWQMSRMETPCIDEETDQGQEPIINSDKNKKADLSMRDRFAKGMLLSGVGDAIGYKNGSWEFCHSGAAIYEELQGLGGIDKIIIKCPAWMVSDDTVMHLATGEALIEASNQEDKEKLFLSLAKAYKGCMNDMEGRAPGDTCISGANMLKPGIGKGYQIPFNPRGGGCGGAMRAMCVGLRYCKPEQRDDLIAVSVESGRMTHHHPVGYLGSLASALFTSYAVQGKPVCSWGRGLLETLPLARKYVESTGHCVKENMEAGDYFEQAWKKYLDLRGLTDGKSEPQFPDQFGFVERDEFVKSVSFSGWGGASGHDAPLIAYDAFLGAGSNWRELCNRAMFHGGDSDSTGVIAACWYGVMYGIADVPTNHYEFLEYRERLESVGEKLYDLAFSGVNELHSAKGKDRDHQVSIMETDTCAREASAMEIPHTEETTDSHQVPMTETEVETGEKTVMEVAQIEEKPEGNQGPIIDSDKSKKADLSMRDRFAKGMLLSGVGDAIGYKNGSWEFCHSGAAIYEELQGMGGIDKIAVKRPAWMVSDDTVMHLATGEALIEASHQEDKEKLFLSMAKAYKECMNDMEGRAPGDTCISGANMLKPGIGKGYQIPFNPRGGGCGGAMRAMCIGLRYCKPEQRDDLIAVSVESGRMTHHHPVGYLGSLASALFTSYAVQGKPVCSWGRGLLETLPLARKYVESTGHCVRENMEAGDYFEQAWKKYLDLRGLTDGKSEPQFPDQFGFEERDQFVKSVSFSGWGGASGHDAPLIAYDAFLGAGSNWGELCNRAMFHGGDSDSTGVIAACWYGVMYGIADVPTNHYKFLEYKERLEAVGEKLYDLAFPHVVELHSAEKNPMTDQVLIIEADTYAKETCVMEIPHTERKNDSPQVHMTEIKAESKEASAMAVCPEDIYIHVHTEEVTGSHQVPMTEAESRKESVLEVALIEEKAEGSQEPMIDSDKNKKTDFSMRDRFTQAMLLSGVGDAIGYKNGSWEFCHSGAAIYEELQGLGGIDKITIKLPDWMVSDDTVMHLATGKALIESGIEGDRENLFLSIAKAYKECMNDMTGRAPGDTCIAGAGMLKPLIRKGYRIPFNPKGGGCGAAMRAMCIGLRYCKPVQRDDLIAVSVESGRMTHHHPVGYLGSLASALFTSYAVQGKPVCSWGRGLLETLPLARKYVESTGHCVKENMEAGDYFEQAWKKYLDLRGLTDGKSEPQFPDQFGFEERDEFVKSVSFSGWGGASGHDAPLIAYDAFLWAGNNWRELCNRAMFHGGDSDSTGVIAACWYGVMYGIADVPVNHYEFLEYRERLESVGEKLYDLAFPSANKESIY